MQTTVSSQEQVQDLRQSIIEQPFTFQYTCFHLEHKGQRINDFIELSEAPGVVANSELTLVEDPYTEKEARMHVVRIRELIGAAGDRTDTLHGIEAGVSLHDFFGSGNHQPEGTAVNGSEALNGYHSDEPAALSVLLPPQQEAAPKTVKALSLSPWNPPPYHLRQKGHLLYLQVTTLEGEQHQITSTVHGFFVNKCTNAKFDPFPRQAPKAHSAHSILTLLSEISPAFDPAFRALQEFNSKRDPLTVFQLTSAIPANPWLVPSVSAQHAQHQADVARTQESFLISGAEGTDTLRDWNEEFQSTREMPSEAVQDRVFRERLTAKLFADYNEAATRGAVLVARGEITPLNPTEDRDAQIFVYNNIFFSFGADGVGTFATEGGDEAARVATGKDVMGVKAVNQLDISGLFTPGTVVVDYMGKRIVGQSIVPGIFKQREPGEHQIDYGGVEGKDIVASNDAFTAVFDKLSTALKVKKHPVWDKEGKRHDLEGSVETKGLLGTDGRKYALDLYRLTPLDVSWLEQHWSEPEKEVETKPADKNYPHRMTVLRPELVEAFARVNVREYIRAELAKKSSTSEEKKEEANGGKVERAISEPGEVTESTKDGEATKEVQKKEDGEKPEAQQERVDLSNFKFALNPDVFCGQIPQTDEEKAELEEDEAKVRAACDYLLTDVIPRLVKDLEQGDVGFPMDGQSLSTLLHKRGINVRYLGKIATLASKEDPRLQALRRLARMEMVARAFKHIANTKMRQLPAIVVPSCISHLLNCLLGTELNPRPAPETEAYMKELYPEIDFSFEQVTPDSLRAEIADQVKMRYRYDLDGDIVDAEKRLQLLREVALKLGIQMETKEYIFSRAQTAVEADPQPNGGDAAAPAVNGHASALTASKKKKKGGSPNRNATSSPGHTTTFRPDDFLNLVPVIKESSPRSALAEEALEAGRISIAQDQKELGQELLLESLSLHEQIYGVLHPEVARVYHQLSNMLYGLDEKNASIELAHKAVIVSERTLGIDHPETVLSYLNLGLLEHSLGNTPVALAYLRHALDLWKIIYGTRHPDSITTINNVAVMLQSMKQYHESRQWFETCLTLSEEVSGKHSISTAALLFQLSQALALDKDMRAAVNRMRESYNIFNTTLGPEDRNTKEAESWLEQLTQSAVTHAKQLKDLANKKIRRVQLTPRGTLKPQPAIGQSSNEPTGSSTGSRFDDQRSIEELLKYIEGSDNPKTTPKKRHANPRRRNVSVSQA